MHRAFGNGIYFRCEILDLLHLHAPIGRRRRDAVRQRRWKGREEGRWRMR